jgi:hypothetical protein
VNVEQVVWTSVCAGSCQTEAYPNSLTATSTLASGADDRRGSLGTATSKYDGLDSSTQIDVTVNGRNLKFVMRLISRLWSSV